jgi:putative NADH-flavin reductase
MNLLILGATGGVGRHLVQLALSRGHRVTTLLRPEREVALPDGVRVVRGTLSDPDALSAALTGAPFGKVDAVLSSVGQQRRHPANPWSRSISPPDLTSVMAHHLVAALGSAGVRRLIAVSAAGVGDSATRLNLTMRFFLATTVIGQAYRDLGLMESVFSQSTLDWLAPRPTRLKDGPASGKPRVTDAFGTFSAIRRADVAAWMLDALDVPVWPDPAWGSRTPQITGA